MDKIKKKIKLQAELLQQPTLGVIAAQKAEAGTYSKHMKKYQVSTSHTHMKSTTVRCLKTVTKT